MSIELLKQHAAMTCLSNLKLVTNATSLGGVGTTAEHRASVKPCNSEIPAGLIRISFGIEERGTLE
jgi:cystathionine gamma-synthase